MEMEIPFGAGTTQHTVFVQITGVKISKEETSQLTNPMGYYKDYHNALLLGVLGCKFLELFESTIQKLLIRRS